MPDGNQDRALALRQEAARCLALAKEAWNPRLRKELTEMAARFHELANSTAAYDFGAVLQSINDDTARQPVTQQQQIQPKKEG
jgi:hypothetical protein